MGTERAAYRGGNLESAGIRPVERVVHARFDGFLECAGLTAKPIFVTKPAGAKRPDAGDQRGRALQGAGRRLGRTAACSDSNSRGEGDRGCDRTKIARNWRNGGQNRSGRRWS